MSDPMRWLEKLAENAPGASKVRAEICKAYINGDVPRVYYDGEQVRVEIIPHDEFYSPQ